MPRAKRQRTTVIVHQASSVELSKRASSNSLSIEVRTGRALLGTLVMGRGCVQWWPNGNKTNDFKPSWVQFAKLLEAEMAILRANHL